MLLVQNSIIFRAGATRIDPEAPRVDPEPPPGHFFPDFSRLHSWTRLPTANCNPAARLHMPDWLPDCFQWPGAGKL